MLEHDYADIPGRIAVQAFCRRQSGLRSSQQGDGDGQQRQHLIDPTPRSTHRRSLRNTSRGKPVPICPAYPNKQPLIKTAIASFDTSMHGMKNSHVTDGRPVADGEYNEQRSSKEEPRKRAHRVSRACDFCHFRSIRCKPSNTDSTSCQSCIEYDRKCTYDRPSKKRGVKSSTTATPTAATNNVDAGYQSAGSGGAGGCDPRLGLPDGLTMPLVMDLVQVYFETVYPLFPIFHRQTLINRLQRGEYNHDRGFHCALMALCALTMARIRDGAVLSKNSSLAVSLDKQIEVHVLYNVAASSMPNNDVNSGGNADVLKCCALLALASLQETNIRGMKMYLGYYHMFAQVHCLTDEGNWPDDLTSVEVEERRRLFWSMYSLDIFSAACFESIIAWRETHLCVKYPTEIDDEELFEDTDLESFRNLTTKSPTNMQQRRSWFVGWNFTTELYRVLEHALDRRQRFMHPEQALTARMFYLENPVSSQHEILGSIMHRYNHLPQRFKEIRHITFDVKADRYGFQAANIAATIQLVRMTLFTTEVATTDERCQVVQEVLQTFTEVPVGYLKAISVPLFHHLASIGTVLISAFRTPLCNASYSRVRTIILELANLLSSIDTVTTATDRPCIRLRTQIERMDAYMISEVARSRMAHYGEAGRYMQTSEINPAAFTDDRHHWTLPAQIMEDWAWAFDFPQPQYGQGGIDT